MQVGLVPKQKCTANVGTIKINLDVDMRPLEKFSLGTLFISNHILLCALADAKTKCARQNIAVNSGKNTFEMC